MEEQKKTLEGTEEKEEVVSAGEPEADKEAGSVQEEAAENETEAAAEEEEETAGTLESDEEETDGEEAEEEDDDSVGTIPPIPKMARGFQIGGKLMFRNEFTITKEIYLEFVKAFMSQYKKLYYIMGGLSIFLGIFSILGGAISSGFIFVMVGIVCLVMPVFLYRSSRDKKFAKQVENNGGKPLERKISFYSDGMEIFSNNGAHSVFQYTDITKIISSKNIYVVVVNKKLSLLVPKNSFVLGNVEEWKKFMSAKGKWKIK